MMRLLGWMACMSVCLAALGAGPQAGAGAAGASLPAESAGAGAQEDASKALQGYIEEINTRGGGLTISSIDIYGKECMVRFTTTTARLARFLAAMDGTSRPIRQEGMSVRAITPGVDNLEVEIDVTLGAPVKGGARLLECLADITAEFPQKSETIWVTFLAMEADHQSCRMTGECSDEAFARKLQADMAGSQAFADVKAAAAFDPSKKLWRYAMVFKYVAKGE